MNDVLKKGVTAVTAVMFLISALAVFAADEELQPRIYIQKMRHDFGEVFEKASFEHSFIVRNQGKADLLIENVKPG